MTRTDEQESLRLRQERWQTAARRLEQERRDRLRALAEADLPGIVSGLQSMPASGIERVSSGLVIRQSLLRRLA